VRAADPVGDLAEPDRLPIEPEIGRAGGRDGERTVAGQPAPPGGILRIGRRHVGEECPRSIQVASTSDSALVSWKDNAGRPCAALFSLVLFARGLGPPSFGFPIAHALTLLALLGAPRVAYRWFRSRGQNMVA